MSLPSSPDPETPPDQQITSLAQLEQMFDEQIPRGEQATAMAFLLALSGPTPSRLYALNKLEHVIGRSKFADIRVDEKAVSQQHAKLVLNGTGYRLVDLGSTNGTHVNDERVDERELVSGDLVRVGETVLAFLLAGEGVERTITLQRLRPALPIAARPQRVSFEQPIDVTPLRHASKDEGMSLEELVGKLLTAWGFARRHWAWLATLPVVFAAAGLISLRTLPPRESAAFTVNFVPTPARNPVENSWERGPNTQNEFFRMPERTFMNSDLIRTTLESLGEKPVSQARLAEVTTNLQLTNVGPHTWQGVYVHPSAEVAEKFLKKHVELFLEDEIQLTLKVIRTEVDFLQKQVGDTEAELTRTESELRTFKEKHLAGLPEQAREQFSSMFELKDRRRELEAELERVRSELKISREKLGSKDPTMEQRVAATEPYQAALADVRRRASEAKASGLGEKHPKLMELRQQEAQLQTLSSKMVHSGSTDVDERASTSYVRIEDHVKQLQAHEVVAQKELGRVSGDIGEIERVVRNLPEVEARFAQLSRLYDATKELHGRLFQQLRRAQVQHELERATAEARYSLIVPPTAQKPSMVKQVLLRGGGGLMLGLVLALLIGAGSELRTFVKRYVKQTA
jgi:pSer/pThr/pTyr-binding forkhead associated (FHA) protein/uncharacterized protein involved in exopolysaccharide biosynthesis